ncbi:MAG: hypothetical protein OEW62_06780 [Candidatus Bathyarchaeota archaeon]|nr:hypothetical protein [Candidatus Bathyarchaeota archaeon]
MERGFADEADKAVMLFSSGFNCAEAVLSVLCQRMEKLVSLVVGLFLLLRLVLVVGLIDLVGLVGL